jgi:DNA-binding IclR family transcriptional regulator
MDVGQRLPLYIGAFGRVLAAVTQVSETALRAEFAQMRWADAPTLDAYLADVAAARRSGWAIDDGHFAVGVASVAVAVRDFGGAVRHGMVASYFRTQLDTAQAEDLAADMLALATDLQGVL